MVAPRFERVWEPRYAPVRLVVLLTLAAGYLVLLADPGNPPTVRDWGVALAAVALGVAGSAAPLLAVCGQAVLLASAVVLIDAGPAVVLVKITASLALFELAVRRPLRQAAWGGAAVVGGYVVHVFATLPAGLPPLLYRLVVVVGGPLLLGTQVRATSRLAVQAAQRADSEARRAEAEARRRESDARAARAAERATIARELHDLVAHHIASMVLRVGVARHVLPALAPPVRDTLDDVHASGSAVLGDLRRLLAVLRDPATVRDEPGVPLIDPEGLVAAVEAVVGRARKLGLTVDACVDPAIGQLDAVRSLALLRLCQEGLTNVAKHAGQTAHARLTLDVDTDGAARLEITNAGRAAGDPASTRGGGYGLVGMRERVELLGGRFDARDDGPGWRLQAVLPAVPAVTSSTMDTPGER